MPDETQRRYLFVAIDRATRWDYFCIYRNQTEASSTDFVRRLIQAAPMRIQKILTDNGSQFTNRFTSKDKHATGKHVFDVSCTERGIAHRLSPPHHPQTNGMVARFNGRISGVVEQTRFTSSTELETTSTRYLNVYNNPIPQRALNHLTPIQSLKKWCAENQIYLLNVCTNRRDLTIRKNPEDRKGSKGSIRLYNHTDTESAKMATGKGVIQGYTGVATVDEKTQIIVDAQAHGTGSEQELLLPVIKATATLSNADRVISADAGYHSQANLKTLAEQKSMPMCPTTDIASVMNVMQINTCMLPSLSRYRTRPKKQKNPSVSGLPIPTWQKIAPTVFAQRANGCMAMDPIAQSMSMRR